MDFCCKYMDMFLDDPRTSIKYGKIFREYCIEGNKGLMIDNCPWCGTKLPESLRDKFFNTLEEEYGIDTNIGECFDRPDLPKEFHTDEWWKKRGL